jgi:hypothetical protein
MKSGWFWPFWRWYALAARIVCIVSWRISSRSEHRRLKWNPGQSSDQIRSVERTQRNATQCLLVPSSSASASSSLAAGGWLPSTPSSQSQISVRLPGPAGPGSPQICVGYRRQFGLARSVGARPVPVCLLGLTVIPGCAVDLLSPPGD